MELKHKLEGMLKAIPLLSEKETDADRIRITEDVGYNKAIRDIIKLLETSPAFSNVIGHVCECITPKPQLRVDGLIECAVCLNEIKQIDA